MNHEDSTPLAQTEYGRVCLCACGCATMAFSRVSLEFDGVAAFEAMAEIVLDEESRRHPDDGFDLRYEWFSISLSPVGSAELARLVREAVDALRWARGEMTFTDDDLRRLGQPPS